MTWTWILLLCFVSPLTSYDEDQWGGIINYKTDIRSLEAWKNGDEGIDPFLKREKRLIDQEVPEVALARDKRLIFDLDFSKQCTEDMSLVEDYMSQQHKSYSESPHWQKQMVDAGAFIPGGVTRAHIVWSGDYYECIKLKVWRNASETLDRKPDIVGKYCLSILGVIVVATPIRVGFCIPESCSKIQAQMIASKHKLPFRMFIDENFCQTEAAPAWDNISTRIWWLFMVLGIFVLVATVYDFYLHLMGSRGTRHEFKLLSNRIKSLVSSTPQTDKLRQFVLSFSALTNTKKIFDTSSTLEDSSYLSNIHGLKAITMAWVVMGHVCVMLNQLFAWKNGVDILEFLKSFWLQAIGGAEFSVDTFITITGFLVVYVVMKGFKKQGSRFNPLIFYAHRIIRLWPPFALLIAYTCGIAAHLPRGPIAPAAFKDQEICRKVWWKALLFIQVYFGEKEKCLPHIWYLCIDMFFIIFSPIFLFPLLKKPKIGYFILSILIPISILIPFLLIHLHDLGAFPARNISVKQREQFMHEVYDVPWGRIHCFFIGAVAGYIYYTRGKNLKLKKIFVTIMWLLVGATMFVIIFGTLPYSSGEKPMLHNMNVFYGTFTRPLWSIGISWIIISCATGYGGVVNSILSWKGFIPISRMSYSAYLVHFSVIGYVVASAKHPYMVDIYFMLYLILSVFLVTMVFAWLMTILAEAPVMQAQSLLIKIIQMRSNRKKRAATPRRVTMSAAAKRKIYEPQKASFPTTANVQVPVLVPQQTTLANSRAIGNTSYTTLIESDSEVFWDIADTKVDTM